MAGMGIIKIRNAQGKRTVRKRGHPRKKITRPAINKRKETRDKNSSAPRTPTTSTKSARKMTGSPQPEGLHGCRAIRSRLCHSTNKENAGTKKPWEKLGSFAHCFTR